MTFIVLIIILTVIFCIILYNVVEYLEKRGTSITQDKNILMYFGLTLLLFSLIEFFLLFLIFHGKDLSKVGNDIIGNDITKEIE